MVVVRDVDVDGLAVVEGGEEFESVGTVRRRRSLSGVAILVYLCVGNGIEEDLVV